MKYFAIFLFIHLVAYAVAQAQEPVEAADSSAPVPAAADAPMKVTVSPSGAELVSMAKKNKSTTVNSEDCTLLLPQLENDYKELNQKYYSLQQSIPTSQESYLASFNEMSQVLFQITATREEDTQKLSQSRDQLKDAMAQFNQGKSDETARKLQESYTDLTIRIFTSLTESQKILDALKTQLAQVESTRTQFSNSRAEMDEIDKQKLALEEKLINLKIKCKPEKNY